MKLYVTKHEGVMPKPAGKKWALKGDLEEMREEAFTHLPRGRSKPKGQ